MRSDGRGNYRFVDAWYRATYVLAMFLRRFFRKKPPISRSLEYLRDLGALPYLCAGRPDEIPLKPRESAELIRTILEGGAHTVLELGVGFSTIAIAFALKKLGRGCCYSVDCHKEWIDNVREKISADLSPFVTFQRSDLVADVVNGDGCSFYRRLPDIAPNLIYVDGPHAKDVPGGPPHAMAADPLKFVCAGLKIMVDGRKENVAFLLRNLRAGVSVKKLSQRTLITLI